MIQNYKLIKYFPDSELIKIIKKLVNANNMSITKNCSLFIYIFFIFFILFFFIYFGSF